MPINVSHCASIARCVMIINFCASRNWFCIVAPTHSVRSTPLTTISTAMLWKTIKVHWGISRCSKLFYTFSRCYFHIESAFSGASISFVLSHIARYDPLRFPRYRGTETLAEENSCIPITHFQCKTHFEHLLSGHQVSIKKQVAPYCVYSPNAHNRILSVLCTLFFSR